MEEPEMRCENGIEEGAVRRREIIQVSDESRNKDKRKRAR